MPTLFGSQLREGDLIGVSPWKTVSQDRIDRFADATDDHQFVHVDAERARCETPFEGTIAHGFLTLSLVSTLAIEAVPSLVTLKAAMLVSIDRVRFTAPVRVDRRIRGHFHFLRATWLAPDRVLLRTRGSIEVEDGAKPALSGDFSWLCTLHETAEATLPIEARLRSASSALRADAMAG